MEARNRKLCDWHGKIQRGETKLLRFQRFEAWDRDRICSLVEIVIKNLPLGITLILEVGDEEKFISRHLATAPETNGRVHEHLLDGQQRLTALWRVFRNNYEWRPILFISRSSTVTRVTKRSKTCLPTCAAVTSRRTAIAIRFGATTQRNLCSAA